MHAGQASLELVLDNLCLRLPYEVVNVGKRPDDHNLGPEGAIPLVTQPLVDRNTATARPLDLDEDHPARWQNHNPIEVTATGRRERFFSDAARRFGP